MGVYRGIGGCVVIQELGSCLGGCWGLGEIVVIRQLGFESRIRW